MLRSVSSIKLSSTGRGPGIRPVIKRPDYTSLVDRNCCLYWLCSREDEFSHHTITCSTIFNSRNDNLFKRTIYNAGRPWANRLLTPCWQKSKMVPPSWWGTWPPTWGCNSTSRAEAHKNSQRHTQRFNYINVLHYVFY